jgi:hypothetical protein
MNTTSTMGTEPAGLTPPLQEALVDNAPNAAGSSTGSLNELIADLFAPGASARVAAYAGLKNGYAHDSDAVNRLLAYAKQHPNNANGIYNTLVVLSHLNYGQLKGVNQAEVRAFAESARSLGSKTSGRVDVLLERLAK